MSHEEWSNKNGTSLTRAQKVAFNQLTWYLTFDMAAELPKTRAAIQAPLPKANRTLKTHIPDLQVIIPPEWVPPEPTSVPNPIYLDLTNRPKSNRRHLAAARYTKHKKVRAVHAHEHQFMDTRQDNDSPQITEWEAIMDIYNNEVRKGLAPPLRKWCHSKTLCSLWITSRNVQQIHSYQTWCMGNN